MWFSFSLHRLCDEATSALDSTTEAEILTSLKSLASNRTSVFVAHRLTTAMQCDEVSILNFCPFLCCISHIARFHMHRTALHLLWLGSGLFDLKLINLSHFPSTAHLTASQWHLQSIHRHDRLFFCRGEIYVRNGHYITFLVTRKHTKKHYSFRPILFVHFFTFWRSQNVCSFWKVNHWNIRRFPLLLSLLNWRGNSACSNCWRLILES